MSDVQITTIARKSGTRRTPHNHVRNVLLISTGILTLLVASSLLCFGGLKPMGRYICGERIFFAETIKRLKAQTHSQLVEVDFQLHNFTFNSIEIESSGTSCSCISLPKETITIKPWSTFAIPLKIYLGEEIGDHTQFFTIIAVQKNSGNQTALSGAVSWRMDKPGFQVN